MFKEFRTFITRGNVVDLAVAVIIGAAFSGVVKSFVADLITPLIGIFGKTPNFQNLHFTINHSQFFIGDFINTVIAFIVIAAAIFFFVVKPINMAIARKNRGAADPDPTTRQCPECISDIPVAATRCAFCTSTVPPVETAAAGA